MQLEDLVSKLNRVEYLLKHMPGRHNQQKHAGDRGIGPVEYQRPSMQRTGGGRLYVTSAIVGQGEPSGRSFGSESEAASWYAEQNRIYTKYEDLQEARSDAEDIIRDVGVLRDNIHSNPDMEFRVGAEEPSRSCGSESGYCYNNALEYVKNNPDTDLAVGIFVNGPNFEGGPKNVNTHAWVIENGEHVDPTLGYHEMGLFYYVVPGKETYKIRSDKYLEAAIEELTTDVRYNSPEVDAVRDVVRGR